MFGRNDRGAKLNKLLHEKQRKEKKLNKELAERMKSKYTADNLKMAKNIMLQEAMTIDATEYEQIVAELKERLNNKS